MLKAYQAVTYTRASVQGISELRFKSLRGLTVALQWGGLSVPDEECAPRGVEGVPGGDVHTC